MPDNLTQQSTVSSAKDPFIELESTSIPSYNSSEASKFDSPPSSSSPFRIPRIPKPGHKEDKGASASLNSYVLIRPISSKFDNMKMLCAVKSSSSSPIDELDNFARGKMQNNSEGKVNASTHMSRNRHVAHAAGVNHQKTVDDLDSFFNVGPRSQSVPRSQTTTPVTT